MNGNPTGQEPDGTAAVRPIFKVFDASRAVEADRYLDRAANTNTHDELRQALALTGIGHALLALGDRLDDRMADVADAVTGVQTQVGVLCDAAQPPRRHWQRGRGRSAARPALSSADMALIRQALADAAAWCRVDECSVGAENERLAFSYLALRERLGGGAS